MNKYLQYIHATCLQWNFSPVNIIKYKKLNLINYIACAKKDLNKEHKYSGINGAPCRSELITYPKHFYCFDISFLELNYFPIVSTCLISVSNML